MAYYYLGAQLPYLFYGQNPPMSSAAYKALAAELMGPGAAALLEYCTLDPDPLAPSYAEPASLTACDFINRWKEWERSLRLNLARNRAVKLKREGLFDAPAYPSEAVIAAKNAMTIESPLEAEIFLDKARWEAIESFQGLSAFSENAMYAYLLKLLLMERRMAFKTEEGYTEYKGLYAAILGSKAGVQEFEVQEPAVHGPYGETK